MPHGQHRRRQIKPHHRIAIVVAVLLAVSSGGAVSRAVRSDGDRSATPAAATSSRPPASDAVKALRPCRTVWRAQRRALTATERSLEQWKVHVDAMNQLVAGEITLAQAQAFWARTRVGASARMDQAEAAVAAYDDVAPRCSNAGHRPSGAEVARALRDCRAAVRARDRAVTAGVVAMSTWKHHIMDMEMLRAGTMTAAQATNMWVMSWHQGVRELAAFDDLRDKAPDARRCCC